MPKTAESDNSHSKKQIRFVALVKSCGKPETVTLWTKPEEDPAFMKAVRSNRVLTITQNPAGGHLTGGEIGFHLKRSALYFVFPKPLPKITARVVGIKFDLIQEKPAKESYERAPIAKKEITLRRTVALSKFHRPKNIPAKKPATVPLKRFIVTVLRSASMEETTTVYASNIREAEAKAIQAVNKKRFKPLAIQDEIKSINGI